MDFIDQKISDLKKLELQKALIEKGWVSFDDLYPDHGSKIDVIWGDGSEQDSVIWIFNVNSFNEYGKPTFWRKTK